jgi:hypothetical protein
MNRETEKQARAETGAGPQITDLRDRVPAMDDKQLGTLLANAQRLAADGTKQQKAAAADLLPVLEAELAKRADNKRAAVAAKASTAKAAKAEAKTRAPKRATAKLASAKA